MDVVNCLAEVEQGSGHTARRATIDDVSNHIVTIGSFHELVSHFDGAIRTSTATTGHRTGQAEEVDALHIVGRCGGSSVFFPLVGCTEVGQLGCGVELARYETGERLQACFTLHIFRLASIQEAEYIGAEATEYRLLEQVVATSKYFM